MLFTTHSTAASWSRAASAGSGGSMELIEVRIRIWGCGCTCHDSQLPEMNTCDGDCHDADPAP